MFDNHLLTYNIWKNNRFFLTFLTFLQMKLLIFASISSLKTLILLKALQSQNLNSYYLWQQRSFILYLTVYFTNRLMVQQWAHLLDLPLLTHFCHTMKKKLVKQLSRKDLSQFFTDVMSIFLYSSNRIITSSIFKIS